MTKVAFSTLLCLCQAPCSEAFPDLVLFSGITGKEKHSWSLLLDPQIHLEFFVRLGHDCPQILAYFAFFFSLFILFLFFLFFLKFFIPLFLMCSPSWTLLPPPSHTIPLGRPSAPAPSIQHRASNLDWHLVSYMTFYMFCFDLYGTFFTSDCIFHLVVGHIFLLLHIPVFFVFFFLMLNNINIIWLRIWIMLSLFKSYYFWLNRHSRNLMISLVLLKFAFKF